MTTGVQRRRGTTVQHSTFTGLEGEITIDTTKDTAVVHDGSTVGGHPLARQDLSNVDPTALSAITGVGTASGDLFIIYDVSTNSLKKITRDELNNAIEQDALANVTITGGSINGTTIGASTASTGAFTTLSASGTATITSLTASRAVFTDASNNLVSNAITGTGNVVMSASPTLTGTITAAAITASGNIIGNGNWTLGNADTDTITVGASFVTGSVLRSAKSATNTLALAAYDVDGASYTNLVTLTASNTPTLTLTSTGVGTINNMSVGATTASTGAFTTLSASSTVSGTGFSTYLASPPAIGSGTASSGAFTSLSASGAFAANGGATLGDASGDALTINSSAVSIPNGLAFSGGNVSIANNLAFTGTGNRITGDFSNATVANRVMFQNSVANSSTIVGVIPSGTGVNTRFQMYNTSSPGSGTNSIFDFGVIGTTDVRLQATYEASGTALPLTIYTGGSERLRIDTSGNVGIGTSSPGSGTKLNVSGRGLFTGGAFDPFDGTASGVSISYDTVNNIGQIAAVQTGVATRTLRILTSQTEFYTSGLERMRIDSSGNLLVGATSSIGGACRVGSYFDGSAINGMNFRDSYAGTGGYFIGFYNSSNTFSGGINHNGTATVSYVTSSDYRLKDNQAPLTGSGAFIDALQPKTWTWTADGSAGVGFIAHEAQAVSPSSVVGEKDAVDAEGNPVMQAMEYGSAEFIANIIAELQDLRKRVSALENK